MTGSELEI